MEFLIDSTHWKNLRPSQAAGNAANLDSTPFSGSGQGYGPKGHEVLGTASPPSWELTLGGAGKTHAW